MAITLDHTIVPARDKAASAKYFSHLLGLTCGDPMGPFVPVQVNASLAFDFDDRLPSFDVHHYAFHVTDQEFDAIFGRVKGSGLAYGSDPRAQENMQINESSGGRLVYFKDLDGHLLEIRTRPSTADKTNP